MSCGCAALFLFHLVLLPDEIFPTVVFDEHNEKHDTYGKLEDTNGMNQFPETNLYLMLNTDTYQIVVEYEGTMHPAEFVSDWQDGD